jgi:hypothetical protein
MSNEQEQEPKTEETAEVEQATPQHQPNFEEIPRLALEVITNPVGFYRSMNKSGGFLDPLVFMVVLSVIAGIISAVLGMAGLGMAGAMTGGLLAIIMVPILVVIFGFIGAGIAYMIWKIMGSQEDFETAFRCVAYTAAIAPINAVVNVVPYLGSIVSSLWPMALLAIASIYVHKRSTQVAWAVFGAIGIIFAVISINAERTSRAMAEQMDDWQETLEELRR